MESFSKKNSIALIGLFLVLPLVGCNSKTSNSTEAHSHSYDSTSLSWNWQKTSIGYSVEASINCASCNETITKTADVSNSVTKSPTCKNEGERTYVAKVEFDSLSFTDSKIFAISSLPHSPSSVYEKNETNHTIRCSKCGDVISSEPHDFDEYTIDIEPQIGISGSKHRRCSICGYKDVQVIPALTPNMDAIKALIDKIPNNLDDINAYSYDAIYDAYDSFSILDEDTLPLLGNAYVQKMNDSKEYYDKYYSSVVKVNPNVTTTDGMGIAEYSSDSSYFSTYGRVFKMTNAVGIEGWNEFKLDQSTMTNACEVRFSIYVQQPTDLSLSTKPYVSDVYDVVNKAFTTKNAGQVKYTLPVNTWTEFVIPANDFAKIQYIALYGADGFAYGVTNAKPAYITGMFAVSKDYYRLSVSEMISLINELPAASSVTAYDYSKLQNIKTSLDMYSSDELPLITNVDKYYAAQTAWDAKYTLVYDPNVNGLPSGHGGSAGTTATMGFANDDIYGRCLAIDAAFDSAVTNAAFFQLYFYGFNEFHYQATDKLIFSIKTPFETVSGSSQTLWIGVDSTRVGQNLTSNGWKQVYGTGSSLNTNGELATSFANRAISIQRYHAKGLLGSYQGRYLLTCIFAERGN